MQQPIKRVFYFSPACTDKINRELGTNIMAGAATNKTLGVCRALLTADQLAFVVTCISPNHKANDKRVKNYLYKDNGVNIVVLRSKGKNLLKRLTSMLLYLIFAIRNLNKGDIVIIYNYFPEYLLACVYLKLFGIRCVLDIEDGPRFADYAVRELLTRCMYPLIKHLCEKRYLIVSKELADQLKLSTVLPVYGVSMHCSSNIETSKFSKYPIQILYGGTINEERGLYIFINAVNELVNKSNIEIEFNVTGRFPIIEMQDLKTLCQKTNGRVRLNLYGELKSADYRNILNVSDVGLNLSLTNREMGATTFPSKLIEYASNGLLIISTDVSDVRYIFGSDGCVILKSDSGKHLADAIIEIANNSNIARQQAIKGNLIIREKCNLLTVGKQIRDFINA